MIAKLARGMLLLCLLPSALLASPEGTPKSGDWKTYERKTAHFSLSLPADWKVVELDPALLDGSLRELARVNPELGYLLGPQVRSMLAAGIEFFAIDGAADFKKLGFATNVNLLTEAMPPRVTLEEVVAANVAQLEKLGSLRGELVRRTAEIGGRQAGWVEYRVLLDPKRGREVAITQVYLAAGDRSLVVTFTTLASEEARYRPVFAAIAERIRVLD